MFILGDKIILNARTFTRGTAAHINSKEKDKNRDKDRGREIDKDKDKGALKDKAENQPLHLLLDKPHQLVAALLKLA